MPLKQPLKQTKEPYAFSRPVATKRSQLVQRIFDSIQEIIFTSSGNLRSGQSDYDTGNGFFFGISGGGVRASIGDSSGRKLTYDGTDLYGIGFLSKKLTADANATTLSNTTTETNVFSVSVPANTLRTTNVLRATIPISAYQVASTNSTLTIRLKYGATTVASIVLDPSGVDASTMNGKIEAWLFADGATGAQEGTLQVGIFEQKLDILATGEKYVSATARGTASEDSTAAKNFIVSLQWGEADAGCVITRTGYVVEAITG